MAAGLAAILIAAMLFALATARAQAPMRLPVDPVALVVVGAEGGRKAQFDIEIARTGAQRMRGLMHRLDLPADRGMLFVFEDEAPRSFWMQNTPTPLDIVFADANGSIVRIARETVPLSTASIRSGGAARFVLEVHAGTAERLGMGTGDRLVHPAIEDR